MQHGRTLRRKDLATTTTTKTRGGRRHENTRTATTSDEEGRRGTAAATDNYRRVSQGLRRGLDFLHYDREDIYNRSPWGLWDCGQERERSTLRRLCHSRGSGSGRDRRFWRPINRGGAPDQAISNAHSHQYSSENSPAPTTGRGQGDSTPNFVGEALYSCQSRNVSPYGSLTIKLCHTLTEAIPVAPLADCPVRLLNRASYSSTAFIEGLNILRNPDSQRTTITFREFPPLEDVGIQISGARNGLPFPAVVI